MELASHGNARKVDQYSDDLIKTMDAAEGDDSMYSLSKAAKPILAWCFGNVLSGRGNSLTSQQISLFHLCPRYSFATYHTRGDP
jgi:hypothetical protein